LIVGELQNATDDDLRGAPRQPPQAHQQLRHPPRSAANGKVSLIAAVSDDLIAKASGPVTGSARPPRSPAVRGGRPQMAQAGGKTRRK